jgi:nucleoside-diphosphate-sugar epimerase
MNLVLTGASGFVGRNLLMSLPQDWRTLAIGGRDATFPAFAAELNRPNLAVASCDLNDADAVRAIFDAHGHTWDCCVYLAAKVDIPWSVRCPKDDLVLNNGGLLNVLEELRTDRMIYFSSGAVYEGLEGEVRPDARISPTLPYAISKLASERYVECFHRRRGSVGSYLNVRFFGAYGPWEAAHKIYGSLIRNFTMQGKTSYHLYGGGQNLIDAMYVDDAIDAIRRMIEGNCWNRTVNLAAGRPMTIEALVHEAASALGVQNAVVTKEGVAHEANQFWGSTAEMRELFQFQPKTSLADGMRRFRDFLLTRP